MRFVQHPTNNKVLGAPGAWDQSKVECGALPVTITEVEGVPAQVSWWEPSAEDLRALQAGAKIRLWIMSPVHPVVAVDVDDKRF